MFAKDVFSKVFVPNFQRRHKCLLNQKSCHLFSVKKKAYLENHHPEYAENQSNAVLSLNGQIFEDLVKQAYPDAVDLKNVDLMKALDESEKLLKEMDDVVIFECPFLFNDVLVISDIVQKIKGKIQIYEIKSSTRLEDHFIDDCAIQNWVSSNCGFEVDKWFITHLNSEYLHQRDRSSDEMLVHS